MPMASRREGRDPQLEYVGDPLYGTRRVLRTGDGLLTGRQHA